VPTKLGATSLGDGRTEFLVWAPLRERMRVAWGRTSERPRSHGDQLPSIEMEARDNGYFHAVADDVVPGARYRYGLDRDLWLPDPASRSQPDGVFGASEVVDPLAFMWDDAAWTPPLLEEYVIYELHVGTFTREGTFGAIVPHLDGLAALGVTAIELMPVGQFPGTRNWGYDGVFPYAAQDSYGGPHGLARLVNECHRRGLAVVLDVIHNHIGPEGNVHGEFGPYFTARYRTPWGPAMNFDGPGSDEVRRYFIENALRWSDEFHVDALRLDAVQGIVDTSARSFLEELSEAADEHAGPLLLIAESDHNDRRVVTPRANGGLGLHAQWSDDFHHSMHALLTGERQGPYADFGSLAHLAAAYRDGFVYSGQFSSFRGRRFGSSSRDIPGERLVVFGQNHDQVGNRPRGERLSQLVDLESARLAAGLTLLAPYVPLLFMGEEYGELAPFHYFVSHTDPELIEDVRRGRGEEFAAFGWTEDSPDPQDETTFNVSKLDHGLKDKEPHRSLAALSRELLHLRKTDPALRSLDKRAMDVSVAGEILQVRRRMREHETVILFNTGPEEAVVAWPGGDWCMLLDSSDPRWSGDQGAAVAPGRLARRSFVVFSKEGLR
jgi:maltooligosyltrehalose trehalohydrolase